MPEPQTVDLTKDGAGPSNALLIMALLILAMIGGWAVYVLLTELNKKKIAPVPDRAPDY